MRAKQKVALFYFGKFERSLKIRRINFWLEGARGRKDFLKQKDTIPPTYIHIYIYQYAPHLKKWKRFHFLFKCFLLTYILNYDIIFNVNS